MRDLIGLLGRVMGLLGELVGALGGVVARVGAGVLGRPRLLGVVKLGLQTVGVVRGRCAGQPARRAATVVAG